MPELFFHPYPTGWVNDRVFAIAQKGNVNAFLFRSNQGAIAIDAGYGARGIGVALLQAGIRRDAVSAVFLTHSDRDHVGGLSAFPQARVYLSAEEEPLVTRQRTRFLGLTHVPRLPVPYVMLGDDQVLEVDGVMVRAIATPGHTPGSMSYLLDGHDPEGARVLFTGDAIALRRGVAQAFFTALNMDQAAVRQSLRRHADLTDVSLLCTAHTGCTTNWPRAIAPWRQLGPEV